MQHTWEGRDMPAKFLVVTPEGKRPLVRPGYRQESNVELMLGSCESRNESMGSINVGCFKYVSSIGFQRTILRKLKHLVVVCIPHQISYCLF